MVKVNSSDRQKISNDPATGNETKNTLNSISDKNTPNVTFKNIFKSNAVKNLDNSIKEIISVVKERGESFLKHPVEENLNSYKESIKIFMKKLKKDFLSMKEEFGTKKNGEQKVYQLINLLEADVASLASETLNDNKATELLCSLDEVRGLVIDILG